MAGCNDMVILRRAHEADAGGIAEVHVETWRQAYRGLIPAAVLDAVDLDKRERMWHTELQTLAADRRPWVAVSPDRIVGFVSVGGSRDDNAASSQGEIYAIYVLAECWSRGVGRNLLARAERDLLAHGYSEAILWCLAANQRARDFYEQVGWHADGTEKTRDFGGEQVAEVRYRIALDKSRVSERA
jgi:GNAT superfamily N-acetyltransferase